MSLARDNDKRRLTKHAEIENSAERFRGERLKTFRLFFFGTCFEDLCSNRARSRRLRHSNIDKANMYRHPLIEDINWLVKAFFTFIFKLIKLLLVNIKSVLRSGQFMLC
jgi:hypothetical protein